MPAVFLVLARHPVYMPLRAMSLLKAPCGESTIVLDTGELEDGG